MKHDLAPELTGITGWVNSDPISLASLRGSVVLLEIWTFGCVNCVRTLPGLRTLYGRYRDRGVEFIGVHSPEFGWERGVEAVRQACDQLGVTWPVAVDDDHRTWRAYRNRYWPHIWLIGRDGRTRADFIGEGHDAEIERVLEELVGEAAA